MINSTFQIIALLIIVATFYLLAVSLKDARLKIEHPLLNSKLVRLALVGVFLSQLWYLLFPALHNAYWLLFNSSVLLSLVSMGANYRKKYLRLDIDFVDYRAFLDIPEDNYMEIEPGVFLRSYRAGSKMIVPSEAAIIELAAQYDLSRYVAVFFKIEKGSYFPPHQHPGNEETYITKGAAQMIVGRALVTPGHPISIPPKTKHHLLAIEYCEGVAFIEK